VNCLRDIPMTQFSIPWILSLNHLSHFWGQVQKHPNSWVRCHALTIRLAGRESNRSQFSTNAHCRHLPGGWHQCTSRSENKAHQLQSHAEEVFMANIKGLASFVSALRVERTNLVDRLRHVDAALSVLGKLGGGSNYTKPGHTVSASVRRRMSLAQRARWAKTRGRAPKPKRTISVAGRRRIAAAQRARWAKLKAGKKK